MKSFKQKLLAAVISFTLLFTLFLAGCTETGFINPGDYLGGGGTASVPDSVDNSQQEQSVQNAAEKDLSDLSSDTSQEGAVSLPQSQTTIDSDGSYILSGSYSGIEIAKGLTVHLFLDGAAIENTSGSAISSGKNCVVTITLIGENTITNSGDDVNALHIKGSLSINGAGSLSITSNSKSAIKVSKDLYIVDSDITVSSQNHGITAQSVCAKNAKITILSAQKDGIQAECDYDEPDNIEDCVFTTESGYISLVNIDYTANVSGDGLQADTFIYINGGTLDIVTNGTFVAYSSSAMTEYDLVADDFRYIYSSGDYHKVASDYMGRETLYALTQGCKGIKVGEIEFDSDGDGEDDTVIYDGDYSIMIKDGVINIDSTDDSIHANSGDIIIDGGTFNIKTYDDGLTADDLLKVNGGNITVSKCYEGLEGGYVEIYGGTIDITAEDDALNAASDITSVKEHIIIAGGEITINAEGDGIDSNGSVFISGGTTYVFGPTSGDNSGLDSETGVMVTGGVLFVCSTLGMVETPVQNSTQYCVSIATNTSVTANSTVYVLDEDENSVIEVTVPKYCRSIIISTPQFENGKTYTAKTDTRQLASFTINSIIT